MKKIITLILVSLICLTTVGCNKTPSNDSVLSENETEIIVEEIITEVQSATDATSETESNVTENNSSQQNNSSQVQSSQQTNSSQNQTPQQPTPSQPTEEQKNVIPEGGRYECWNSGITLTAGQEFPEICEEYDAYYYGDYKYVYNIGIICGHTDIKTEYDDTVVGWAVIAVGRKKVYGEILESINGEPVVSIGEYKTGPTSTKTGGFAFCSNIVVAPKIPNTVVSMYMAFYNCDSLEEVPEIPSSVVSMQNTFSYCTSLTTAPTIPSSVTNMLGAFYGCTSLTTAPIISNSVTNMRAAFYGCTSLTTASAIPSSVTNMENAFYGCTSLFGTITINANPTAYDWCFVRVDMSKITLTGEASKEMLNNLGSTGENYIPIS